MSGLKFGIIACSWSQLEFSTAVLRLRCFDLFSSIIQLWDHGLPGHWLAHEIYNPKRAVLEKKPQALSTKHILGALSSLWGLCIATVIFIAENGTSSLSRRKPRPEPSSFAKGGFTVSRKLGSANSRNSFAVITFNKIR